MLEAVMVRDFGRIPWSSSFSELSQTQFVRSYCKTSTVEVHLESSDQENRCFVVFECRRWIRGL